MKKQYGVDNILPKCQSKIPIPEIRGRYNKQSKKEVVSIDDSPIELSVVIPFFRAGYIGWVPFEALIRQKGVGFNWELIVMEENFDNPFTLPRILEYKDRLAAVRCSRITYISMSKWIPLSAKWYFLIQNTDPNTKVVFCNSADNYFSEHRMAMQFDKLKDNKFNWYKIMGNVTYDIESGQHAKRILSDSKRTDTSGKAMHIRLARELPLANVKRGVDGWTYNTLSRTKHGLKPYCDYSDIWKQTINIAGLNNLSIKQGYRVVNFKPPLTFCCDSIANHLPEEVASRLIASKKHLRDHKKLIDKSHIRLRG